MIFKKKDIKRDLDFWSKSGDIRNSFKTLFANIRFASLDNPAKSIVITSSGINEGKTMVSANLAYAIASAGYKTLLIDCDLRKKSLYKIIDCRPEFGVLSILSGLCMPGDACAQTKVENLYFLDNVDKIPSPPDILASDRFAILIDRFHAMFDYIIIDTPPISSFVDAAIVSNIADATILVARSGKIKKEKLREAYKQLESAKANVIGTVLTFSTNKSSKDYYYAYYNKKNERVNKEDFPEKFNVSSYISQNNLNS